jgi:acyl-coenzyme A thioesterase 13
MLTADIQPRERHSSSRGESSKAWVDPASLPNHNHASFINGNTPDYVKQLNYNTFICYGVGEEDCFGYKVGRAVKFTEVNVNRKMERQGRREATTTAELEVTKRALPFSAPHCNLLMGSH